MSVHAYVDNLTTERNRAWEAQKQILDRAVAEKRDLTGEEREQVERIDADLDAKDQEIRDWLDRDRRERENDQAREEWAKVVRPDVQEKREQSESDRLRAVLTGRSEPMVLDFTAIANEKRAIRAGATGAQFRDLTVGTAGAGGNTVPTSFMRRLYDYMETFSGMRRTNATIITTAGGESMEFPKVTSHGTAAIVGEGTALAEADPAFGKLTLGSWKYGQLLQISRELLEDSGVDIVEFVARDMGRALARATDAHYVTGNGTNKPLGVMAAAGTAVTSLGTNADTITFDNLIDVLYSVDEAYRMNGGHWFTSDTNAGTIRKLKDSDGQYHWQPSSQAGEPDRLLGFPVVTDPNVSAIGTSSTSVAFGDFSAYYIRDVGQVRVESSADYAFANDLVTYKGTLRTDGDLIDLTGAIKVYRGGTA